MGFDPNAINLGLVFGSVQVLYKHVREGGSEGNAYFAYVVRSGGSRGKMLILPK